MKGSMLQRTKVFSFNSAYPNFDNCKFAFYWLCALMYECQGQVAILCLSEKGAKNDL